MSTEIVKRPSGGTSSDPVQLGQVLAQSGYFSDAKQAAQAAVKVMAGQEIGLPPVASMTGVYIVQGRVTIGANLMAALMRKHPDYDYRVTEHTPEACEIVVLYKDEKAGTSRFTIEDAKKANLVKNGPWTQHPRNMLFARAISNAAKWYAPDVFAGNPVYTPDELGAEVDGETGEVVKLPPQDASGQAVGITEATEAVKEAFPEATVEKPKPDPSEIGRDRFAALLEQANGPSVEDLAKLLKANGYEGSGSLVSDAAYEKAKELVAEAYPSQTSMGDE